MLFAKINLRTQTDQHNLTTQSGWVTVKDGHALQILVWSHDVLLQNIQKKVEERKYKHPKCKRQFPVSVLQR